MSASMRELAMKRSEFELDELLRLEINGTAQSLHIRATRSGLPPLLIVQGGPGLPLRNEVQSFRNLCLEDRFTVVYWDQRSCGNVPRAESLSLDLLLDDLCTMLRQISARTGEKVCILGISLGGSLAMQAASLEAGLVGAMVALRNATAIQAALLPALTELDLLADWPATKIPIHLVFGENDLLSPPSLIESASRLLKKGDSLVVLPRAGHMAHFDRPDAVRQLLHE